MTPKMRRTESTLVVLAILTFTLVELDCFQLPKVDFPIEDCLSHDLDVLLLDSIPSRMVADPLRYRRQYMNDIHEILLTMAATFFEDGIVTTNNSRVRLASVSHIDIDSYLDNWSFMSSEPLPNLIEHSIT